MDKLNHSEQLIQPIDSTTNVRLLSDKINYIHKPYEPTLIEVVGSFVYDILEENMYNNWKH